MNKSTFKYKAFISYSHTDERIGKWLHKKIERFRVPQKLIFKKFGIDVSKRLYPIFRDREELPTASNLGEVINNALNDSEFLIVICSPNSAKSIWVNEEIRYFKKLGRQKNIICLIIGGIPNKPKSLSTELSCIKCNNGLKLNPDEKESGIYFCPYCEEDISHYNGLDECLAPELIDLIDKDTYSKNISTSALNTIDIRSNRDGKKKSFLKIVAFLINLPYEKLFEVVRKKKNKRLAISIIFSPFILWFAFVLAILALEATYNIMHRISPSQRYSIELSYEIVGHTKGKINLKDTREIQAIALKSKGLFVFDELKIGRSRESVLPSVYDDKFFSGDLYLNEEFIYKNREKLENVAGWHNWLTENHLNEVNSLSNFIVINDSTSPINVTDANKLLPKIQGGYITCHDENKISAIKNSLPAGCYHIDYYKPGPIWISYKILRIKGKPRIDEFFSFNLLPTIYHNNESLGDIIWTRGMAQKNGYLSIFAGGKNGAFRVDKYHKHFDDNPGSPVESIETDTILTPNTFYTVVLKIKSISDDFD